MLQCRGGCGAGTSCARGLQPRLLTSAWLPPAPRTPWGRQHKHRRATCVTYASARGRVERATRRDLPEVADSFVLSFFLDGKEDLLDGSSRRRLVSAALKDLEGRYGAGGRAGEQRALLVVRDADGSVVACAGVEPQPFQQNVILRGALRASPPADAVRRPVVSNLAVAASARRRGLAAQLMRACEDLCREWGFDECLLLVESTNKRARNLYSKLGYKLLPGGDEPDAPTLKVVNAAVADVRVTNVAMRRSLKPFPAGALENARLRDAVALAGGGAASYWLATHPDAVPSDLGAVQEAVQALLADTLGVTLP